MTQPPQKPQAPQSPKQTIPYRGGAPAIPADSAPQPPPKPPRPMTFAASRRSWTEPKVRFWLLITIVLLAIAAWFIFDQVNEYTNERNLIQHGALVTATILDVNGDSHAKFLPAEVNYVEMQFTWQGQQYTVNGIPSSMSGYVTHNQTVPLHINPNRPTEWTDKTAPEPLAQRLFAGSVIVPVVIATALAAFLLRRKVARMWKEVDAQAYSVVEVVTSALAPLSHTVRCVDATGRDKNVLTVYLPPKFPKPKPGDVLWLIHTPGKSRFAFAAAPYE